MDPSSLVGPSNILGNPAPYWFLVILKVLGFSLHVVPMNLWLAGIIVAMMMRLRKHEHAFIWSGRLMRQMPIIIALGINFGIVPLLFVQVAYYKVFYPATILMAWPWLAIIALLTVAYYGVYAYSLGLVSQENKLSKWRRIAGWLSALIFVVIGFTFANGFSLMANVSAWPVLWQKTMFSGAVLGTGHNLGDPTLFPRYLMMIGLALTTLAAYIAFDAAVFGSRETAQYRLWAQGFAFKLYTVGMAWYALFGATYVFGTWHNDVYFAMFSSPRIVLTILTAVSPGLVWLVLLSRYNASAAPRAGAITLAILQFLVIGLNAVSRQFVQNLELAPYLDVVAEPVNLQLSPLVVFLVLFVAGVAAVVWMLRRVVKEVRTQ